jgi:hypothetical protein
MHPEFLREMTDLRGREMRARARQDRLARLARMVSRRGRQSARVDETPEFVIPAIPDYVDGSFQTEPAVGEASQEPAAHHAA